MSLLTSAAVDCAILVNSSGLFVSSETIAPMHLKIQKFPVPNTDVPFKVLFAIGYNFWRALICIPHAA